MTARGKSKVPVGASTEQMPPVLVQPEFQAFHECRGMPATVRILQTPPTGWRISGPRFLIVGVHFCAWCGIELVKDGA